MKLRRDWSGTHVEDLNSRNGIKVNKKKVNRKTMKDGDELEVGNVRLLYVDPSDAAAPAVELPDEPVAEEEEGDEEEEHTQNIPAPRASAVAKKVKPKEEEPKEEEPPPEEPKAEEPPPPEPEPVPEPVAEPPPEDPARPGSDRAAASQPDAAEARRRHGRRSHCGQVRHAEDGAAGADGRVRPAGTRTDHRGPRGRVRAPPLPSPTGRGPG